MNSRKALSLVLCICMLASLFTGCGLGGKQEIQLQEPAASQTEPENGAGEETPGEEIYLADEDEINYETNLVTGGGSKSPAQADSAAADISDSGAVQVKPVKAETAKKEPAKAETQKGEKKDDKKDDKSEAAEDGADKIVGTEEPEAKDPILDLIDKNMKGEEDDEADDRNQPADSDQDLPFDQQQPDIFEEGLVEYADNTLLVKLQKLNLDAATESLKGAGVGKLDLMFELEEHIWYTAYLLKDTDVNAALEAVRQVTGVETAEYNFTYEAASVTDIEDVDTTAAVEAVAQNPQFADQWYMNDFGILEGWTHAAANADGMAKGIIVAVIDTGVDYNHADLKANMWKNTGEVEGNGRDDDGNGYVDDYYGIDMTAKRGSAMDDHGHGTHVAGIIGAANNKEGIVGLAYDAQIMAIKAGDASGYFLQDNVAKSIIYAYEHGADVINMSFGGSASSIAVQDALAVAYNRCVLVASAGNEGANNKALPNYPAAHKYVLGVMSVDSAAVESAFTNYDINAYSNVEYEVYAPGEQILSTLPDNRYAKLSGTSMAAPVVAAQAAILRSMYPDRNTYPTKYIYAQISGTAESVVECYDPRIHGPHNIPGLTNYYLSMTELPVPQIGMSDYTLFDTETFAGVNAGVVKGVEYTNNGDGIVDAGEVIALGMTLKNRWGMSEDTTIHIDATSDLGVEHPYVTFLNNDINYGSVGTYSESDSGKLYSADGEMWTGWDKPFYIKIDENIPNDYTVTLNVTMTYKNGLDENDDTVYSSTDKIVLKIRRGTVISGQITEDMTLTKDHYYIIPTSTVIMEGVTVTVEPGTQIQFWCSDPEDSYAENGIATLQVYGSFITNGTAEEPVEIFPSGWMDKYRVEIYGAGSNSYVELNHTNVVNPYLYEIDKADGCEFTQNYKERLKYRRLYSSAGSVATSEELGKVAISVVSDSVFYKLGGSKNSSPAHFDIQDGIYSRCIFVDSDIDFGMTSAENCVFYGNNNYWEESYGGTSTLTPSVMSSVITTQYLFRDNLSGKTYVIVEGITETDIRDRFFELVGMELASFHTPELLNRAFENIPGKKYNYEEYRCGIFERDGSLYNYDGSELIIENDNVELSYYSVNNEMYKRIEYEDDSYGCCIVIENGYSNSSSAYIVEIPGEIYITNIQLEDYLVNLDMNQTYQIHAQLTPHTADKNTLVYESLNEDVITVDKSGLVTSVGQGTAAVRVYSPDYAVSNYVTFNVKEVIPLEDIQIEEESVYLNVGEDYKLSLIFNPGNTTEKSVEYSTSDDTIAVVSPVGVITAVGSGTAEITVTGKDGISDSITVNVNIPVESLSFTESTYVTDLEKDDGTDFYPVFMPENTTQRELIWESSNPEVCEVNADGKLVKYKTGIAELKATVKGTDISAAATVAVIDELIDDNVIKIVKDDRYNQPGDYYALMDNGDVWSWGSQFTAPKKLSIVGAEDICLWYRNDINTSAGLYVLDQGGTVNAYSFPDSNGNCTLREAAVLCDIVSLYDGDGSYYTSMYAISKDGSVWGWGNNSSGQLGDTTLGERVYSPVQLNFEPKAVKISVVMNTAIYLLTDEGDVYRLYQGIEKVLSGVEEIYAYGEDYVAADLGDEIYCLASGKSGPYKKIRENERILTPYLGYYIEDGKVYVNNDRRNQDTYIQIPVVENVTNVIWMEDNQYFQTSDGKFYAMGSAVNNALGTGSTENATEPVRVYFGLTENMNGLSVKKTNVNDNHILMEDNLVLEWTQALQTSSNWGYITLTDGAGAQKSFLKTLDLNRLVITPRSGFVDGETYTLTIPANAFKDRVKATNEAYTLTFTYYDSDRVNVVKMMRYAPNGADIKLVLQEDGSLWAWGCDDANGISYDAPTEIIASGVKDFVISQDGQLYILNAEGAVSKYTVTGSDFVYGLEDADAPVLNRAIASLGAEQENYGTFFAVAEDGSVWGWGNNDKYQLGLGYAGEPVAEPTEIELTLYMEETEDVMKVVSSEQGTLFLTEDGDLYHAGKASYYEHKTPVSTVYYVADQEEELIFTDIYSSESKNYIYADTEGIHLLKYDLNNSAMSMTKSCEGERLGHHYYYIDDGRLHLIGGYGGYFTTHAYDGYDDTVGVTGVTKVFDFGENIYVQTESGKFYALGEAANYGLAQPSERNADTPVRVYFDGTDGSGAKANPAQITPATVKLMKNDEEYFALLDDGSLWMWGSKHETPVMLFDRGVKDFLVYGLELLILNEDNELMKYATSGDFTYSLYKSDYFIEKLPGIKALSSEKENDGIYYAIGENGDVYVNCYGSTGIEILTLPDPVKKVVAGGTNGAAFLTRTGNVYILGGTSNMSYDTPTKVSFEAKVTDMYAGESDLYVYWRQDGKTRRWSFQDNSSSWFAHDTEVYYGSHILNIDSVTGELYVSEGSADAFFNTNDFEGGVVLAVETGADKVFDFGENVFITATDGRFYGTGSGENNFLADSTIESSDTPVEIKFVRPEDVKNDAVIDEEKWNNRFYWSAEEILKKWDEFVDKGLNTRFYSNVILNRLNDDNVESWLRIQAPTGSIGTVIGFGGNYWGTTNMELVNKQILDFDDFSNLVDINEGEILTEAPEDTFPFVVDAYLEIGGEEGEEAERVDVVGNQLVTFVVEFNRDMDTEIPLTVRFGSYYPYADYEVAGEYVSPRVWKGTLQLTTIIENGYQLWSVSNGTAAGTDLKLYTDWGRFPFKIDTSSAQAMVMQADSNENGIQLTWTQDDFVTLAGYNVYRSESEDGYYTRLNQYVIPADTKEFLDDGVEPGKTYYYNFTVVQSDMTESEPSGKVTATALDTLAPNVYHTPVFDAFTGSSLVISANVTDNVGINTVTLYYRTPGTEEWKYQTMTNYNDKYSAVIPAAEVTTDGLEYYIDATDGVSHTLKGSAEDPYAITVKLAVSASDKGDVNGDGVITVIDAMMLLMHTNDRVNLNAEQFARADLNDDGQLTAAEALRIIMYANNKIGSIL